MQVQDSQPIIVQLVQEPAKEVTLADVLVGAFGIIGLLVMLALALGGVLAIVMINWNRRHPPETSHLPPVA